MASVDIVVTEKAKRSSAVASASLSLSMSVEVSRQETTPHQWMPQAGRLAITAGASCGVQIMLVTVE